MKKIISFELYADMGFLKKPDINEKIYLTYNMLHKPCVLGILGAIVGLNGFSENNREPLYYKKLKHIPVGIKPIGDGCENGTFNKTVITYNNAIGYANKGIEGAPNVQTILNISEQTLIKPAYRIYLLLDLSSELENSLYEKIKSQKSEYIPYLGKNDYSAWWQGGDAVKEYDVDPYNGNEDYRIETTFIKCKPLVNSIIDDDQEDDFGDINLANIGDYMYFEKLPIDYNEDLYQYNYGDFAYTDWQISKDSVIENLYRTDAGIVQLN